MAYDPTIYDNDNPPSLSSLNLNKSEQGIRDASNGLDNITGTLKISGWTDGYYININSSPVNTSSLVSHPLKRCKVVSCQENDVFTITITCASSARAFAFIKANGDLVYHSKVNESFTNKVIVTPPNAAFLVLDDSKAQTTDEFTNLCYYGENLAEYSTKNDTDIKNARKDLNNEILRQIQYSTNGNLTTKDFLLSPDASYTKSYIKSDLELVIDSSSMNANYIVNIYRVSKGDVIHLIGEDAKLTQASVPFAAFYEDLDTWGILVVNGSNVNTDYNVSYTVPENGYIVIAEYSGFNTLSAYATRSVVNFTDFDNIRGDVVYIKDGDALTEDADYNTYYIKANGTIASVGQTHTTYDVHEFEVEAGQPYLISGLAKLSGSFPIAGFKTTSGTSGTLDILASATTTEQQYNVPFIPTENGYIFIASVSNFGTLSVYKAIQSTELEQTLDEAKKMVINPWYGKKVVWIGTSVSFGKNATKSYAQEIANYYGFELVNCSVPGLAIELEDGAIKTYGSLTASIAEYAEAGITIADAPITPYIPGGNYNNFYKTWENVFSQENADADLWVFDVIPNNADFDLSDWNAFNKSTWKYNDNSAFDTHRDTFYGALLFLLNKMYELNPNARFVFLIGSLFGYANGKTAYETIAAQWNIGIIDLWGKIITTPPSIEKIYSENGTDGHPSTFAHEQMGKMLVGEFNRFS